MLESKDWWDKAEIVSKLLGATLIPLAVAVSAYFINGQISKRQEQTERAKLAIGILSEPVAQSDGAVRPLRRWAVDTMADIYEFSESDQELLLSGGFSLPPLFSERGLLEDIRNGFFERMLVDSLGRIEGALGRELSEDEINELLNLVKSCRVGLVLVEDGEFVCGDR